MDSQIIDNIIKQLKSLKTSSNTEKISKATLKKWDNCEDVNQVKKIPIKELRALCNHFDIKASGEKTMLANRLWENWEENCSDSDYDSDETDSESDESDEE
jgi:hypothetical protein